MKQLLLFSTSILIAISSLGQMQWGIDFEDTITLQRVVIDTNHNPNNVWQVGTPNKTYFNGAYLSPNAIVTDTSQPYPTNDTSSFIVIHQAGDGWAMPYPKVDIGGWYYVNSDTLTDYGFIEFSADMGATWVSVENSLLPWCTWGASEIKPVFSGNSNGWKPFYYCIDVPSPVSYYDTILYKFTFISDSVQGNHDGLMFDNLHFEDWAEGIDEIENDNLISIYPNPVSDKLYIEMIQGGSKSSSIQIFNIQGQLVYTTKCLIEDYIDVSQLSNGMYFLRYFDKELLSIKRFDVIK